MVKKLLCVVLAFSLMGCETLKKHPEYLWVPVGVGIGILLSQQNSNADCRPCDRAQYRVVPQ